VGNGLDTSSQLNGWNASFSRQQRFHPALRLCMEVMIERSLRFELPGKAGGIPSGDGKGILLTYSTKRSRFLWKVTGKIKLAKE
jgi:hypothetical protein